MEMRHIVIGTLFFLLVILLGGCKGIVESNPAIFGNYIGKPITGPQARYSRAMFVARTSGNVDELNRLYYEDSRGQTCLPQGWSSRSIVASPQPISSRQVGPRYYSHFGRVLLVPAKGTSGYDDYLWRTKQK